MPSAQSQFAAEFIAFLAAVAGLALVLLRSSLASRTTAGGYLMGGGFAATAAGSFLHGSLIVDSATDPILVVVRLAGVLGIAAGAWSWAAGRTSQQILWISSAILALAVIGDGVGADSVAAGARAIGALGLGTAVLAASRRSIAARVAASAAGSLLLLVLVLSLALSAVLSGTVESEAKTRLSTRANLVATQVEDSTAEVNKTTLFVAAFLLGTVGEPQPGQPNHLVELARQPTDTNVNVLGRRLRQMAISQTTSFIYYGAQAAAPGVRFTPLASADPGGSLQRDPAVSGNQVPDLPPELVASLSTEPVVNEVSCPRSSRSALVLDGGDVLSVAAYPLCVEPYGLVGAMVGVTGLDSAYLQGEARDDDRLSLALVSRSGLLESFGRQPAAPQLQSLASDVLAQDAGISRTVGDRYLSAEPVHQGDAPVFVLVASTPVSAVTQTREELFRTLFLIALGGTLLALLLAAVVGERIGSGVRRLTAAAESIQRGDLAVRADVVTEDEVGVLGSAFNSMAASIEDKTAALAEAAADEARLRNRLEAVVAGMGEALLAVDADGVITDFNQAAEELIGVAAASARGASADQIVELISDEGVDLNRRLRRPSPRRWSAFATVKAADGSQIPVQVSSGVLRDPEGGLAGGVFVLRDLRSEREVERMKNEFLAHIGHELRTPLTPLIGYAELIARKEFPPAQVRSLNEEILSSARRLQRIIEMLEFVASAGAGRLPLRPEALNFRALLDDAAERWAEKVASSHPIVRRVGRGLPEVVADPRWVKVSLDELLDNAVKFSPQGGKIAMSVAVADNGKGPGVEISVVDRGIGMDEDQQSAAFGEFVQGDGSDTRSYGGLGLGLNLVQRVAEAHGGSVSCESVPGKGSKLSIFLPGAPKKKTTRR